MVPAVRRPGVRCPMLAWLVLSVLAFSLLAGQDKSRPPQASVNKTTAKARPAAKNTARTKTMRKLADQPLVSTVGFNRVFRSAKMKAPAGYVEKRAEFSGVQCRLKALPQVADGALAAVDYQTPGQVLTLGGPKLEPGAIVFDKASRKVIQILDRNGADKYRYQAPPIDQIVEEFEIPEQSIYLTTGNIERSIVPIQLVSMTAAMKQSMLARGAQPLVQRAMQTRSTGSSSSGEPALQFKFGGGAIDLTTPSGGTVSVELSGDVTISDIRVDAKYTCFKGYKFAIVAGEEINLKAAATLRMNEVAYLPLCALDIPFGIGHVRGGLYLIIGFNGEARLEVLLNERMTLEGGVRGATFLYVPTGPLPYLLPSNFSVSCDPKFTGEIQAGFYAGPVLSVELAGIDLLAAELRFGAALAVTASADNPDNFVDVDLDAIIYSFFTVLGESFTLVDERWGLDSRRELRTGGQVACLARADAYRRYFKGTVTPILAGDPPFNGTVDIMTGDPRDSAADVKLGSLACTDGVFAGQIALADQYRQKGQLVHLRYRNSKGQDGLSDPFPLTFPFSDLAIEYADLFNNVMEGRVAGVWDPDTKSMVQFSGSVQVTLTAADGKQEGWVLAVDGKGQFAKTYNFLPDQRVVARLSWNGWELTSEEMVTESGLVFYCAPAYRGERDYRTIDDQDTVMTLMDDYVFLNFGLYNKRGKGLILPAVKAKCAIVKANMVKGFNGWNLIESWASVPDSGRDYAFKLQTLPDRPDQAAWTELYVYRWAEPGSVRYTAQPADGTKSEPKDVSAKGRSTTGKTDSRKTARPADGQVKTLPAGSDPKSRSATSAAGVEEKVTTLDIRKQILAAINQRGEIMAFTEKEAQRWRGIRADYQDVDQFDHNGFALLETNMRNNGAAVIRIRGEYEYEGGTFIAAASFNLQLLPYKTPWKPERTTQSPRTKRFLEQKIDESQGYTTHPDLD